MQINALTGTNKDVWRQERRDEDGKGGRREEKRIERAKAIPGQFLPHSMPHVSWLPRASSSISNF